MSGRSARVTLFKMSPVPLTFCAMIAELCVTFGEVGCSAHANPASTGRASAANRRFISVHLPFQNAMGEIHTAAVAGGRAGPHSQLLLVTALPRHNHPHPHARGSSQDDSVRLLSASSGPSHQDAAAVGCSGPFAWSFSGLVGG